ncbi:hypothetical protein HanIR_Chr08g0386991 [Helianthus annuus]|nr:hypothetical protein HanIR_Chr08g0386991 [Helianthus annuus]
MTIYQNRPSSICKLRNCHHGLASLYNTTLYIFTYSQTPPNSYNLCFNVFTYFFLPTKMFKKKHIIIQFSLTQHVHKQLHNLPTCHCPLSSLLMLQNSA